MTGTWKKREKKDFNEQKGTEDKSKQDDWLLCQEIYSRSSVSLSMYKVLSICCTFYVPCLPLYSYLRLLSPLISFSLVRSLPFSWLMGHWPAALVPHLQLILEGVWGGSFGWAVAPLEPEGLVAEGGALQAGRLRGQGLCLQLKGVTKWACSQAIQGLNSDPEEEEMSRSEQGLSRKALSRIT